MDPGFCATAIIFETSAAGPKGAQESQKRLALLVVTLFGTPKTHYPSGGREAIHYDIGMFAATIDTHLYRNLGKSRGLEDGVFGKRFRRKPVVAHITRTKAWQQGRRDILEWEYASAALSQTLAEQGAQKIIAVDHDELLVRIANRTLASFPLASARQLQQPGSRREGCLADFIKPNQFDIIVAYSGKGIDGRIRGWDARATRCCPCLSSGWSCRSCRDTMSQFTIYGTASCWLGLHDIFGLELGDITNSLCCHDVGLWRPTGFFGVTEAFPHFHVWHARIVVADLSLHFTVRLDKGDSDTTMQAQSRDEEGGTRQHCCFRQTFLSCRRGTSSYQIFKENHFHLE